MSTSFGTSQAQNFFVKALILVISLIYGHHYRLSSILSCCAVDKTQPIVFHTFYIFTEELILTGYFVVNDFFQTWSIWMILHHRPINSIEH